MATTALDAGIPAWTTKAKKDGRDPLGMQTTSVAFYQQLMPGISNVTLHIRYYGFYAWLAHHYAVDVGNTSLEGWCRYLRRAEALYALIAVHNDARGGIAGVEWAQELLAREGDLVVFRQGTDREPGQPQYLKQKFGAFGAAYGSQLVEIGILEIVPSHKVTVPTALIGDRLAVAFEVAFEGSSEAFLAAAGAGEVSRAELTAWASILPGRIPTAGEEVELYKELLFPGRMSTGSNAARDQTLRLVLLAARQIGALPKMDQLRWEIYDWQFGRGGAGVDLREGEPARAFQWSVYHANDLLHVAYESLLQDALEVLSGAPAGMPLDRLVAATVDRLLSSISAHGPTSWAEWQTCVSLPDNQQSLNEGSEKHLTGQILLSARRGASTSEHSRRCVMKLLAILHTRLAGLRDRIAEVAPVLAEGEFVRSLVTELRFLDANREVPLAVMLTRLVKQRVLDRHLWVAIQKFRGQQGDYTFLFEADEGLVRFRGMDGPVLTSPRLASAIAFLQDLHFLGNDGPTEAGIELLEAA